MVGFVWVLRIDNDRFLQQRSCRHAGRISNPRTWPPTEKYTCLTSPAMAYPIPGPLGHTGARVYGNPQIRASGTGSPSGPPLPAYSLYCWSTKSGSHCLNTKSWREACIKNSFFKSCSRNIPFHHRSPPRTHS